GGAGRRDGRARADPARRPRADQGALDGDRAPPAPPRPPGGAGGLTARAAAPAPARRHRRGRHRVDPLRPEVDAVRAGGASDPGASVSSMPPLRPGNRLFYALDLPRPARRRLAALGRERAAMVEGRPVPEENLHLTLQFLGRVEVDLGSSLAG